MEKGKIGERVMMDLIQRIKEYLHVDDTDDASDYDDVDNTEDYYDDDDTEIKNTSKVVEDEKNLRLL